MKKVINTKFYSIKQMENMTYNLRKKFSMYCSISCNISLNAFINPFDPFDPVDLRIKYNIYIDPKHIYFISWPELQQGYYELMNQKGE